MSMERFAEAEEFIEKAVKLNQSSEASFYNYGIILKRLGKVALAKLQFDRALQLNSKVYETWNSRGTVLNDLKQYNQAVSDFDKAISLNPNYYDAFCNKAKSLTAVKRYDDAFSAYDKALALKPDLAEAWLGRGNVFVELRRYDEAFAAYDKALALSPDLAEAWLGRGYVFAELKRYEEALVAYDKALALKLDWVEAWLGRGYVFVELKRYDEAFAAYDKALALSPDLAEAWLGRGKSFAELKRYDEALAAYGKALALKPDLAEAWLNRGNVFAELKRYDEALPAYGKALALKLDLVEAWLGRGYVFVELKRYDDAFAAYDKALALKPNLADAWFGRGKVFVELKRYDEALAAYGKVLAHKPAEAWLNRGHVFGELRRYDEAFAAYDKALLLKPDLAEAWLGRGNVLAELKRYDEAFAAYDKALALKPDLAEAWLSRGYVFGELKRYDEALAAYDKVLALKPAEAWIGRGYVFAELKRYDEAFAAYDKALALKPDSSGAETTRLHCKMHLCDWSNFTAECEQLISLVKNKKFVEPFSFIAISTSREDQLTNAKLWISEKYRASAQPIRSGEIYNHNKIRVGYVSADFREHPVSYLMAGICECHDKTQFEITAISIGPDDNSKLRNRLKNAFDYFFDGSVLSDDEIAHRIKQNEIDILVDLNGFTQGARTGIFARRPSPVQVNYLGFPATMGADYIDYIIADGMLVPQSHQQDYSEKIVYLPNSYLINEKRAISEKVFSRADMGLTDNGFVFCCFNTSYKILPGVFDCWMRIINKVEGSVFWLPESSETTARNLRMEAKARGIDPRRLVFAKKLPAYPDYLARYRVADLFLDTLPYNAHSTASDALWAELPVLTQLGEAFAGRVAASLLRAVGLPELITTTQQAYEELAVELATNPERFAAIKGKLAEKRLTTTLFNTKLFTSHIEEAYSTMYGRHQAGLPPGHIYIS